MTNSFLAVKGSGSSNPPQLHWINQVWTSAGPSATARHRARAFPAHPTSGVGSDPVADFFQQVWAWVLDWWLLLLLIAAVAAVVFTKPTKRRPDKEDPDRTPPGGGGGFA